MSKRLRIFNCFCVRVTAVLIVTILLGAILTHWLISTYTLQTTFENLRTRMKLIAQTAALSIDAELLKQIPPIRSSIDLPQYKIIRDRLIQIKQVSPQIEYVYTLTKTDQPGIWKFLVDADPIDKQGAKNLTSLPGDRYDASRFPEMMKAFSGPQADKKLQVDEWGVTLSGYAPIYDERGQAIAVLGVDIAADDVYQIQGEIRKRLLAMSAMGIFFSVLIGLWLSSRVTQPIRTLIEGTRHLANGELQYQVKIKDADEITELAESFNKMASSLHESRLKLLSYFYSVVRSLVLILEMRDQYTRGHSESVAIYAGKIALRMGFSEEKVRLFKRMTLLHDIGKLGVRDSILNKPGKLTDAEWEEIRKHPLIGENILKPVMNNEEMLAIVRGHHERYDGTGYPDKLQGDKINIFAAIVSVADAYDAMTSDRPYRKAMSKQAAIAELKLHRGTQFHPDVVDAFLKLLDEEETKST